MLEQLRPGCLFEGAQNHLPPLNLWGVLTHGDWAIMATSVLIHQRCVGQSVAECGWIAQSGGMLQSALLLPEVW